MRWHYIPRKWFTDPSIYPDLVFGDVGRGIAIGEEKHVVESILANSEAKRITLEAINSRTIAEAVGSIASEMHEPISTLQFSLFAPIEYFVTMYVDWARERRFSVQRDELIVDGFRLRLFWSSKYVDHKEFILSEKSLCRWIAKPNVSNRIEVEIRESEKPGEMELKVQTVFNFSILHPKKIRVLQPTQLPQI